MVGNNHDPSTSFPYHFFCNLLQKLRRAHNKYGAIMPRLVTTLRDCSPTFRSVDPFPGALSGALDFGSGARICKWVALGLKFITSPIQNANPKRIVLPYTLLDAWISPLGWQPRRSRQGCYLTPIKSTPLLAIVRILPWAQLHAFPGILGIETLFKNIRTRNGRRRFNLLTKHLQGFHCLQTFLIPKKAIPTHKLVVWHVRANRALVG